MKDFNEFSKINEEAVDNDVIKSVDDATDSKDDLEETGTEEENTEEENTEEESNGDASYLYKTLSALFTSRDQAHYFHLQTESYAEHIALNGYYDAILLLADSLAEAAQGEFGRIKGKIEFTLEDYDRDLMLKHFEDTLVIIRECKNENDSEAIDNIYQEIEALIMKTQYLLSLK